MLSRTDNVSDNRQNSKIQDVAKHGREVRVEAAITSKAVGSAEKKEIAYISAIETVNSEAE